MKLLTGNQELDTRQLASPDYEGAVSYVLAVIDEFPNVQADRYSELRRAADSQLRMYRVAAAQTLASPRDASILAAELAGTATPATKTDGSTGCHDRDSRTQVTSRLAAATVPRARRTSTIVLHRGGACPSATPWLPTAAVAAGYQCRVGHSSWHKNHDPVLR